MKLKNVVSLRFVLLGLVCSVVLSTARADVYSDVYLWMRGMVRTNESGVVVKKGSFFNSISNAYLAAGNVTVNNALCVSNETIRFPMAHISRPTSYLHFTQPVTTTNAAATGAAATGYCRPESVKFDNVLGGFTNGYAMVTRFRLSKAQSLQQHWNWMINFGYGNGKGFMLGFSGTNECSRTMRPFGYPVDYFGSYGLTVTNGVWYDLGISVNGRTMTWMIAGDGPQMDYPDVTVTRSKTFTLPTDSTHTFQPSGTSFTLGTESPYGGAVACTTNYGYTGNNSNALKAFRGDIQSFALWRRPLTTAELREAMAWPRLDVFCVGVENDAAAEFSGTTDETGTVPEGSGWDFPKSLAAGAEAKIAFTCDKNLNDKINQFFRWKSTSGSPEAMLAVTLNGTSLGTKVVRPGVFRHWFADAGLFKSGANTLTVKRVDAGATPLVPDVARLGGGWQIGYEDWAYTEFSHETTGRYENDAQDGNFQNYRRALLWAYATTNSLIHFALPDDLAGRYAGRLSMRATGNLGPKPKFSMAFDGTQIYAGEPTANQILSFDFPPETLGAGDHTIWMACGQGCSNGSGGYVSPDYIRFQLLAPQNGALIILR